MPDDIRISDLSPVSEITNGALMELSNEDSGAETGYVSVKMTITQLATKLNVSMQYLTDLLTTNKTIVGAINEINDRLTIGTSAPTSLMGNDGDFYLQYTEGTGGADDEVDAFYVKLDGVWCQISTGGGGSGGHTILDNSGTALTQRTNLQFKGAYSEDNSGDDTTEVNVVRSMTKAAYNQLSADEKVGIINITDEEVTATDLPISGNDPTDTKTYIDTGLSGKADTSDIPTVQTISGVAIDTANVTSGLIECYKYGRVVVVNVISLSTKVAYAGTNVRVATGLPIPLSSYQRSVFIEVDTQKAYRCAVNSSGELFSWSQNIPINSNLCGTIVYISAT